MRSAVRGPELTVLAGTPNRPFQHAPKPQSSRTAASSVAAERRSVSAERRSVAMALRSVTTHVVALVILVFAAAEARAADDPDSSSFVIPPPPATVPPRLAIEVHTGMTLPLANEGLCPRRVGCVLQAGGGVGASLELRWPSGFGGLLGYDLGFLDSDSVYELAVQQLMRVGFRYTAPTEYVFHPVFELGLGAMVLGDTFRAATFGVVMQGFSGVEAELTESYGVRLGLGMRAFSHSEFRTDRDGVLRGHLVRFSEAIFLEVGLTIM